MSLYREILSRTIPRGSGTINQRILTFNAYFTSSAYAIFPNNLKQRDKIMHNLKSLVYNVTKIKNLVIEIIMSSINK